MLGRQFAHMQELILLRLISALKERPVPSYVSSVEHRSIRIPYRHSTSSLPILQPYHRQVQSEKTSSATLAQR